MKKRSSITSLVLVAFLLIGLYAVAIRVTPAPPGPPEPPKVEKAQKPPAEEEETPKRPLPHPLSPHAQPVKPKGGKQNIVKASSVPEKPQFNPSSIDVTPDYWKENKDGEAGVKAMDAKVKQANEALTAEREAQKKADADQKAKEATDAKKSGAKGTSPAAK